MSKKISKFQERFTELLNKAKSNGLTQGDVAREIGVRQSQISQWQNKNQIGGENLIKAARYFKVSPEWLIGASDDKYYAPSKNKGELYEQLILDTDYYVVPRMLVSRQADTEGTNNELIRFLMNELQTLKTKSA